MNLFALTLIAPAVCLLGAVCFTSRMFNSHANLVRQLVTVLVGLQFFLALAFAVVNLALGNPARSMVLFSWPGAANAGLGIHYDAVASLMLLLVSFIGWVICRFSIRYIDGNAQQGRYFRWTAVTIGAVSLLVISGNLLMFFAAWVMTSFGLHQLLLHYPERPAAQRAAWTKFTISRIGDCFLIAAIAMIYREFGTFQFDQLFAAAGSTTSATAAAIAWCLVLGAVTKSAQFPLHTWLPETMETPTPVSALMHAGIVNAGGYLVIRLSPLIVEAPAALAALAIIGTATVCFAGIVMLTQTSVKRTLAYSTIAQMGFMMLQCGLGAFSAAMLHIIAHSLYKAHAFLSSGSVLAEASKTNSSEAVARSRLVRLRPLLASAVCAVASVAAAGYLCGVDFAEKSGGIALGFILCLALTGWLWDVLRLEDSKARSAGLVVVPLLALLYVAGFLSVDALVAASLPALPAESFSWIPLSVVGFAFCGLFGFQWLLSQERGREWLAPLHVHASNGFYIDACLHRVFASVITSKD